MQIHFFTRNTTDMHRYVKYLKIKHYNKTYYVCNKNSKTKKRWQLIMKKWEIKHTNWN